MLLLKGIAQWTGRSQTIWVDCSSGVFIGQLVNGYQDTWHGTNEMVQRMKHCYTSISIRVWSFSTHKKKALVRHCTLGIPVLVRWRQKDP